ncbi:hypothetical protein IQ235_11185 [Oscillatoriales cyanobacterium LEGE 11467]|uniref:Uncharacterized protein n=1 Tax=Zarconia navalis LEGE 11467 TaxID=1828826 RepID=A0A928VVY9_9CYAN|nr:hypothetical protein [Zarconia navalis]MBE9041344.1 hypothetical protein [Zarconia navalis LEGE 11467]
MRKSDLRSKKSAIAGLIKERSRSHNTLEAICLGHPQDFLAFAQTQAACKRAPIGTVYLSVAMKTSADLPSVMQIVTNIYILRVKSRISL